MLENVSEALSAIQDKANESKTSQKRKKSVPDYKPEPEPEHRNEKPTFLKDISRFNGKDLCPIDVNPGYVMAHIIKDGVPHRRFLSEKDIEKENKANGGFLPIMYCSDGKSVIIDYDKDKGRFYVKAFLANVNNLKEIRLLKWVLSIQGVEMVLKIAFFATILFWISSSKDEILKAVATQGTAQLQQLKAESKDLYRAPDPTEAVTEDAQKPALENSHPGRLIH